MKTLKAPFPYFGGKSRAAHLVWSRFGDVPNYVEPFAGSLAVLLSRSSVPKVETVNDVNGHLCNFWRSIQADPKATAGYATWPVSELDLVARHKWLREAGGPIVAKLKDDPDFYDPKIAGWWAWGLACWIGSGFCETASEQLPHLGDAGQGVTKKLPHLGDAGRAIGCDSLTEWFTDLQERLIRVRVACGDWSRVLGPSVTFKHGMTGVFLDPPYSTDHCEDVYRTGDVGSSVRTWCLENGSNQLLRIALCGYSGEGHEVLESNGWHCEPWKTAGGFGSQSDGRGRENAGRERIWFSPACLSGGLFDGEPT